MTALTITAEPDAERSPRRLGALGAALGGGCLLIIVVVVSRTWTARDTHDFMLFIAALGIFVGTALAIGGLIDYRSARRSREIAARVETKLDKMSAELQKINDDSTGLGAARTVDLQEVARAVMERITVTHEQALLSYLTFGKQFTDQLKANAQSTSRDAVAELTTRFDSMEKRMDTMRERHLEELEEAYQLGRLTGRGEAGV